MTSNTIGQVLKDYRKHYEHTLKSISKITGIKEARLSRAENSKEPCSFNTIKKYANALNVSISEIIKAWEERNNISIDTDSHKIINEIYKNRQIRAKNDRE